MNSEEIKKWKEKYNECRTDEDREIEEKLTKRITMNKKVTMDDLKEIVRWKLALFPPSEKKILKDVENNNPEKVERVSEEALKCSTDKEKLEKLMKIKGVGPAVASTILTFSAPDQYGIFDIHAFREMFDGVDAELYPVLKYLEQIKKIKKETGFSGRDIDKAYFQKNFVDCPKEKIRKKQ